MTFALLNLIVLLHIFPSNSFHRKEKIRRFTKGFLFNFAHRIEKKTGKKSGNVMDVACKFNSETSLRVFAIQNNVSVYITFVT